MVEEADFGIDQRIRYGNEMNLEFWGLTFETAPAQLKWVSAGPLALK